MTTFKYGYHYLFFFIVILFSNKIIAEEIPPYYFSLHNTQNQIEQKQRLDRNNALRESIKPKNEILKNKNKQNDIKDNTCFKIDNIEIKNTTKLTYKTQCYLINSFLSRCLTINDINTITELITNHYIKSGYITSKAFIPEQNLSNNKLTIHVIEGRIQSIEIEDTSSYLVNTIFPNHKNNHLNLRDIEQGLEQLNQSKTAKYTIDIQSGDKLGYSILIIKKKGNKYPISTRLTLDNMGSKNTGKNLFTTVLSLDSLIGLGEQWELTANTNTDINRAHYHRYYSTQLTLPYGYWSYRYQIYHGESAYVIKGKNTDYRYKSKSDHQQFDINRLVYRDNQQRITLQASLKYKKIRTQLAQQPLFINSPTLTSLSFSPQYSIMLNKAYFMLNPRVEIGLPILGATEESVSNHALKSQYRKLSINSSYQYYLPYQLSYLTSFYGQYTPDNLYSAEQITIGGLYSVRGFKEDNISGNKGFYWRNEINKEIITEKYGQWRLTTALDYGVISADQYENKRHTLIGSALGVLFHSPSFSSQLFINKPLYFPSELNPERLSISWSIAFVF